jgi:amino acid adenylation domain-containing protein
MLGLIESDGDELRRAAGVGTEQSRPGVPKDAFAEGDIAIIGMSGIFPGAPDLDAFWNNLVAGKSFFKRFREASAERRGASSPRDSEEPGGDDLWGAFLDGIDEFDADFFSVSPREAARMDPQQRLFLKVAWKTFEDAGYHPGAFPGASVGVFVGVGSNEYLELGRRLGVATDELNLTELYPNLLPNRVSHFFNLCGPSELIDTACSSSAVAVHRAAMSLAAGECALALAGGVNLLLMPDRFLAMKNAGLLSPDGSCRVFDRKADGVIRGEGVGAVLLKPLRRAALDGDAIYAVIKGSAVNHGGRTGSLLASNPVAQLEVIRQAFRRAGVEAATVSYAEAQGSCTEAGDALETRVMHEALGHSPQGATDEREPSQRCRIGTLKPNVGHLEAAAGVAAVIKAALALKHRRVPGVARFEELNPTINLDQQRFEISAATTDWPPSTDAQGQPQPRRASVNVFAYGGTNAHIVLEEFAATPGPETEDASRQVVVFSARDEISLRATVSDFNAFLRRQDDTQARQPTLADIAYTLQSGRMEMRSRLAIVAATTAELRERLELFLAGTPAVEHTLNAELPARGEALESFGRDPEDKAYLTELWLKGKLRKIAALWVRGAVIKWSELPQTCARRRVSLPGYSFAPTRFWWPSKAEHVEVETASASSKETAWAGDTAAFLLEQLGRVLGLGAAPTETASLVAEKSLRSLGFDSLLALELRSRIRQERGADVPLKILLEAYDFSQLVEGLAGLLETSGGEEPQPGMSELGQLAFVPEPERRFEPFPLSDIQMAYLLGRNDYATLGGNSCHLYWEFENAEWDVERLSRAWNRLVARHEMLRAVFLPDGRQQTLREVEAYRLEVQDLRGESESERERRLEAVRGEMSHERFAPERWPLFRIAVSRLPGRMRLHFSIDLLLVDGMSIFLLLEQWAQGYRAPEQEEKPLAVSFRDYVLHLEKLKSTAIYRRALEYWRRACESLPPAPELPQRVEPQTLRAPRFCRHERRFAAGAWAALQDQAHRRGLTPNIVLLAAYAEVISRWARRKQFTLNVTVAHRLPVAAGIVDVIGDFTSTVLVAFDHEEMANFMTRAAILSRRLASDLDHCLVSGVQVLRELSQQRREPVMMPVVFTSMLGYSASLKQKVAPGTLGELIYGITQTPQVGLDCQVREDGDSLYVCWDFVEELYPAQLVEDMFDSYAALLERLSQDDDCWQETRLELLPERQRARRAAVNDTSTPRQFELLHAGFLEQVRERRDALALVATGCRLTYGDLYECARGIAHDLRVGGVEPNQLVALVMRKGWEQVAGALGVLIAGAAYLPVDATLPQARIRQLLSIGDVRVVLTQMEVRECVEWPEGLRCVVVERGATPAAGAATPDPDIEGFQNPASPGDLAYVIFTSGSTGVPKGVMISHQAAAHTVRDINRRFRVETSDRTLALSAMSFDLSVYDVFGLLAAGGTIILPEADSLRDPQYLAALVARERVTIWNSVPSYLQLLADCAGANASEQLDSLRLVLLSGDRIPLGLVPRARAMCPRALLVSLGGATEASIWSIFHEIESIDPHWESIPYGKPLANQTFHILDKYGADCPDWVPGDLHIGGAGVALGYWRDEEKTREKFFEHPVTGERLYRTGDVGRYWPDGKIEFLGREDLQVKVGGYRVELGEIEAALMQSQGIVEAAVVAFTNGTGLRHLAAFFVAAQAATLTTKELRESLKARLPSYMLPSAWRQLDAMPLTPNGKLDRRALEKMAVANKTVRPNEAQTTEENLLAQMLTEPGVLKEPAERQKFVDEKKSIRADLDGALCFSLHGAEPSTLADEYRRRRSSRTFAGRKLDRDALAALLGRLRGIALDGRIKYFFPSAGSAYCVQTYVQIKAGGFENLPQGIYYYHPLRHELQRISEDDPLSAGLHVPANQKLFTESGFSIFFVADLRAVEPLYGNLGLDFARLEAGYMGQVLAEAATSCGLGLCPIGYLDFALLRPHFKLDEAHLLLHSFVGGALVEEAGGEILTSSSASIAPPQVRTESRAMTSAKLAAAAIARPSDMSGARSLAATAARRKSLEHEIAGIWAEELQGERPGADESFFEIGGDSFSAVGVRQRLTERFGLPVSITDLFRFPTVGELARYLDSLEHPVQEAPAIYPAPSPDTGDFDTRGDLRRAVRSRISGRQEQD